MTYKEKEQVDKIFPLFSSERKELRDQWEDLEVYVNWERFLKKKAFEIIEDEVEKTFFKLHPELNP